MGDSQNEQNKDKLANGASGANHDSIDDSNDSIAGEQPRLSNMCRWTNIIRHYNLPILAADVKRVVTVMVETYQLMFASSALSYQDAYAHGARVAEIAMAEHASLAHNRDALLQAIEKRVGDVIRSVTIERKLRTAF